MEFTIKEIVSKMQEILREIEAQYNLIRALAIDVNTGSSDSIDDRTLVYDASTYDSLDECTQAIVKLIRQLRSEHRKRLIANLLVKYEGE